MFSAEIIAGKLKFDTNEILGVEFIDINKLLKMGDDKLRSSKPRHQSILNLINNKVYPLEIIENFDLKNK